MGDHKIVEYEAYGKTFVVPKEMDFLSMEEKANVMYLVHAILDDIPGDENLIESVIVDIEKHTILKNMYAEYFEKIAQQKNIYKV